MYLCHCLRATQMWGPGGFPVCTWGGALGHASSRSRVAFFMHQGVVSVIQKERRMRGHTCTNFEYVVCAVFAFVGWGESGGRRREATKDNEVWEATMWTVAYLMLFGYHT